MATRMITLSHETEAQEEQETSAVVPSATLSELAGRAFRAQLVANEAAAELRKAKKELESQLAVEGLSSLSGEVDFNGRDKAYSVSIEAETREVVDVNKLKDLVEPSVFMKCVKPAAQATIKDLAGSFVLRQVIVPKEGKPALKLRAVK